MKLRMLVAAGLLAVAASSVAVAADPFDDARYYMGIKKNEDALKLIDSGQFDINMQTDEGYTLLHYAADNGNLEMVRALLERASASLDAAARHIEQLQRVVRVVVKETPAGQSLDLERSQPSYQYVGPPSLAAGYEAPGGPWFV